MESKTPNKEVLNAGSIQRNEVVRILVTGCSFVKLHIETRGGLTLASVWCLMRVQVDADLWALISSIT